MFTISTHNGGSQAHRGHNIRDKRCVSKDQNIIPDGEHESWIDIKPRDAYDQIFGDAIRAYNARQTRAERMVVDYYKQMCQAKQKHAVYELIAGVYSKGDDVIPPLVAKQILRQYVDEWSKRNPHLRLIGAYWHNDERDSQMHVHLDYVPFADGYTRGMQRQNGLVKALGQQGFLKDGRDTAQILWERAENKALEDICAQFGIQIEHPQRNGEKREHLRQELFKLDTRVRELTAERDKLQERVMSLEQVRDIEHKASRWDKTKELIDRDDLERLTRTAAQVDQMRERVNEIEAAEKDATRIREAADQYADTVRRMADFDMQQQIAAAKAERDRLTRRCEELQKIIDRNPDAAKDYQIEQERKHMVQRRRRFTYDHEIER